MITDSSPSDRGAFSLPGELTAPAHGKSPRYGNPPPGHRELSVIRELSAGGTRTLRDSVPSLREWRPPTPDHCRPPFFSHSDEHPLLALPPSFPLPTHPPTR